MSFRRIDRPEFAALSSLIAAAAGINAWNRIATALRFAPPCHGA